MAELPDVLPGPALPIQAAEKTGTIYVIDLVGFSALTEDRISDDEKFGTEQITQLVTELFGQLIDELSIHGIEFGGFAGDALIAWQSVGSDTLSEAALQDLAARACQNVQAGLTCRTARASGPFWVGEIQLDNSLRPLVWGSAVKDAFAALSIQLRPPFKPSAATQTHRLPKTNLLAAASVAKRWAIIVQVLPPAACGDVTTDQLIQIISAYSEICDAYSAEIDNLVQDDKGLLAILVLPQSRREDRNACDALLTALTHGRSPLVQPNRATATFGTLFRCRPHFSSQSVAITIGDPINQAAKSLTDQHAASAHSARASLQPKRTTSQFLIGREDETEQLLEALIQSRQAPHIAVLTGPAGIGKTALAQTLRTAQSEASIHIEATPGIRYLPFGAAQDLAEACGISASRVFHADGLAMLAQNLPHTMIIENWQWCDEDSKRLIRQLQINRQAGLLLVTSRQDVTDLEASTSIRVTALDFDQASQLIEILAPEVLDTALKQTVFDISKGTPFWLVQAALHYSEQTHGSPTALSGLEGLLTARAQALSDPAIAVWRLHCAWRLPLAFSAARDILKTFDIALSPSHLDALEALGWLTTDPTRPSSGLRPAHDILAEWGVADLPVTFERSLHAQIARAVSKQDGSPSRIARHWQSADKKLRAAIWYARAAQVADRAGAHRLTVDHLSQSETLSRDVKRKSQTRTLQNLALSATAVWGIGKLRRAKQVLAAFDAVAKTTPDSLQKKNALQRAATIQSEVGQFAGNSKLIFSGMYKGWRNRRGAPGAYEVKARRDAFIYYLLGLSRLPVSGRFDRLVSRAHELGEYRSETLLGCAAGTLNMSRGKWQEAGTVLLSSHAAIAQTDDRQMLGVVQCLLALCDLYQGRTEDSYAWFERVAEIGREQDHQLFNVWGAYGKAEAQLYAGNIADADNDARDAKRISVGLGDLQSVCIIEGVLAQTTLIQGDLGAARKHARNAMRFAAKLPPTNFSTLEGIAAAAQVGCELKALGMTEPDLDTIIKTSRKALKSYAQVFRIARPRYQYVEGLYARMHGDENRARKWIEKARIAASDLGMNYEQILAKRGLEMNTERQHGATAEVY